MGVCISKMENEFFTVRKSERDLQTLYNYSYIPVYLKTMLNTCFSMGSNLRLENLYIKLPLRIKKWILILINDELSFYLSLRITP